MQTPTHERKLSVKDLVRSYNRFDNFSAFDVVDDNTDNVWSDLNVEEKSRKYWKVVKKHIPVVFFFKRPLKKDKLLKKNKPAEKIQNEAQKEPTLKRKIVVYLPEREWFNKKFEVEVGKHISEKIVSFNTLAGDIKRRKRWEKEYHLQHEYKEPLRTDVPHIVWSGPPLKTCFCISPMDQCDCEGDMSLPPSRFPSELYSKILYWLHCPLLLKCLQTQRHKNLQTLFVKRLQEHLEAEAAVQKQLKEMNLKRGPEFCISRCYQYYTPPAHESNKYFEQKKELQRAYKNKTVITPTKLTSVELLQKQKMQTLPSAPPAIADEMIDGLYRSVSTQATTDEKGEFVMGAVSHILFGNATVYQDIEGTPYCIRNYEEVVTKKPEPVVKKLENLLSISGIKKRVSILTSNLLSSIVEIEDTGIPINTRCTQDPPLDNYFESIKEPSKLKVVKLPKEEVCPCCKKYKELQTIKQDQVQNNVVDDYDDFESKGAESLFNARFKRRQLGISDHDDQNVAGKQILPFEDNTPGEKRKNSEKEFKLKNINDNIELLKQDLTTNKRQSKSMLNSKENRIEKKIGKLALRIFRNIGKNDEMNSLEFLESIKPCCIDNLCKQLEIKISDEKFLRKLLVDQVFRRLYWCIYKIEEKRLNNIIENIDTKIEIVPADSRGKILKLVDSLKSSMHKFSDFIKKQKSSLKDFAKKIKEAHIRSKSRNALSLEDFKLKLKKSFKKINNAVSSFVKRHYSKSSNNIKRLISSLKKGTDKEHSSSSDRPSDVTLQNITGARDSKTSEKEVFSLQYNSTFESYSKSNNQ